MLWLDVLCGAWILFQKSNYIYKQKISQMFYCEDH